MKIGMRILMINHSSKQCGVADYGRRVYDILKGNILIELAEVNTVEQYRMAILDYTPDTILYNYHYATLPFITDDVIDRKYKHVAIFHEAALNFTPDKIIDTSIRPLFENIELAYIKNPVPVIGSFGFGFPDKNFTGVAERVKEQFDDAVLRLNIPFAEYGDREGYLAKMQVEKVKMVLQNTNIKLQVSHEYLSQTDLLSFLRGNDINLFLYNKSYGRGLASCTDYALSVCRPIGVSDSEMFRHLPVELQNTDLRWLMDNWFEILSPVYESNSNEKLVEGFKEVLCQ